MLEFSLYTRHTRSFHDRTHYSHARFVHSHRPNASSGPREWSFGHIDGRRLAADGTIRERHGPSARESSRMSLCALRGRPTELISRGMGRNLRRSAGLPYFENACGSATHRACSATALRWSM